MGTRPLKKEKGRAVKMMMKRVKGAIKLLRLLVGTRPVKKEERRVVKMMMMKTPVQKRV
jgi:hypothetical protein